MKRISFCLCFLVIMAADCFGQSNPLVGTWEMVSGKHTFYDGSANEWDQKKDGGRILRIYNDTHYSLIGREADGELMWALAGSYVVDGNTSIEQVEFSSKAPWRGKTLEGTYSVEGDTCKLSYSSKFDGAKAEELYQRVK